MVVYHLHHQVFSNGIYEMAHHLSALLEQSDHSAVAFEVSEGPLDDRLSPFDLEQPPIDARVVLHLLLTQYYLQLFWHHQSQTHRVPPSLVHPPSDAHYL